MLATLREGQRIETRLAKSDGPEGQRRVTRTRERVPSMSGSEEAAGASPATAAAFGVLQWWVKVQVRAQGAGTAQRSGQLIE